MKLFLKHIFRTLIKSPAQPLLILLTVVLAVSTGVTAFRIRDMFEAHAEEEQQKAAELGDVVISLKRDSRVRMLFCEDAEAIVGDQGSVVGEYILTVFAEREGEVRAVNAAATDLVSADRYFEFEYLEYGRFSSSALERSVVISETLSRAWDLHVGDPLCISLLGEEQTYTVQAVARDYGMLRDRDVLIPISGVVRMFAERVPAIAALGDSFVPYNQLMIRMSDTEALPLLFESLSASPAFADYQVDLARNTAHTDYLMLVQGVAVEVLMLLLLVMCALLIGTSLNLLRLQRDTEYALFCGAGASRRHLETLQLTEGMVYALVGCVGGVLLASPMLRFVGGLFLWQKEPLTLQAADVLFGVLFAILFMTVCTVQHLWRQKDTPLAARLSDELQTPIGQLSPLRALLPPLCLVGLDLILLAALPTSLRYIPAVLGCLILIWLLYAAIPYFLRGWTVPVERCMDRVSSPRAWLLLAVKSIGNRTALRQVTRLLSVLLSLLITVFVIGTTLIDQQQLLNEVITTDLVAVNAPTGVADSLLKDSQVEGVATFDLISGAEVSEGHTAMVALLSGDVEACFSRAFVPSRMPHGNEAVLSKGLAVLMNTSVGEEITVTVQGVPYTFTVCAVDNIPSNLIYLELEAVPTSRELIAVKLTDEAASDPETTQRITGDLEIQGAIMLEAEALFGTMPQTLAGFISLLGWVVTASAVLALIGCGNMMVQQYRMWRQERWLLRLSGMDRRMLMRMCIAEFTATVISAAVPALLFGGLMCALLNIGVQSFGWILF